MDTGWNRAIYRPLRQSRQLFSLTTLFFHLKDYQGEWQYWISDYTDANGYLALDTPPLGVGLRRKVVLSSIPQQVATATRTVGHQVMSSGHASRLKRESKT